MKLIFFSKCKKFYIYFKNAIKVSEKICGFWDNNAWNRYKNFSQFWQEYMWSPVKVLTNSPKISNLIKRDVSELTLSGING